MIFEWESRDFSHGEMVYGSQELPILFHTVVFFWNTLHLPIIMMINQY